jgi:hypothetical protein
VLSRRERAAAPRTLQHHAQAYAARRDHERSASSPRRVSFRMFDIAHERVLITKESGIAALVEGTPYASLPLRDFYASLIVHEIVHGVMHQNLTRKATTHAAYEYPAYALQLESLPADVRETFLSSFDQALKSDILFTDSVLFFDPFFFAARAYHHYKSAMPDACAHLTGLLSGEAGFIAPAM